MTFLPIVERELRVGARRRYTYWSRSFAAGFALLIFGALYLLALASKGMAFSGGQEQFGILKWLSFVFACFAGVFLTADSLSEEKREGTLGLLFLTDLRGYDVVLGKLISSSVQAFFALLAAFPIVASTLLLGGVTGFEFWRAVLIICNTLFITISIGLAVSSVSRDAIKAINGALLAGLAFLLGPQLCDLAVAGFDPSFFVPHLSYISPTYSFYKAGMFLPPHFWLCLGLQHALGWGLLAWSSFCTPRAWQEKSTGADRLRPALAERWRFGGQRSRNALRRRLLGDNPVVWLVLRDRWLGRLVWIVALTASIELGWMLVHHNDFAPIVFKSTTTSTTTTTTTTTIHRSNGVVFTTAVAGAPSFPFARIAFQYLQTLLMLGMSLWVASQASRFFVEALRNGALELILVTPVGPREIVRAQVTALLRTFLLPCVFLLLMQVANGIMSILGMYPAGASSGGFSMIGFQIVALVCGLVNFVTNLLALAWFGMWMGLTSRKTSIAVLKTYCFVVLLPGFALTFVMGMIMILTMFGSGFGKAGGGIGHLWLGTVVAAVLHLGKDLFFIFWSRRKLRMDFREAATQSGRAAMSYPALIPPVAFPVSAAPAIPGGPRAPL